MTWNVSLINSQLNTLVSSGIADNVYTYQEVLSLLDTVAAGGVTATEWTDLKTVYDNASPLFASDYVKTITYDVVYGNLANAKWWGGAKTATGVAVLGDMSANTSETNARRLIDKWFLGADLPMPVAGGDTATGKAATGVFTYAVATGPLFVNGAVASDVNQGAVGDCYYVATLGSIANISPALISNAFIDNGNGTYGVKFYLNGVSAYTTVNMSLPTYASGAASFASNVTRSLSGELWVSLLEKAFIQLNTQADVDNKMADWTGENSYQAVEGGFASPIKQLSNLNYKYYSSYYSGIPDAYAAGELLADDAQTYKQTLITALKAGSIGWLATFGETTGANGKTNFVAGHAFMLLGYNTATDKFIIRNPWGGDGTSDFNPQFEASITEFWNDTVKGLVAISDATSVDPVFSYTISSGSDTPAAGVTEGGLATFTVTRSGSGSASTVYVSTLQGSADSSDYQPLSKIALSFSAYETSKTVTVDTRVDNLTEGNENFTLSAYKQQSDTTSIASAASFIKDTAVSNFTYTLASNAGTAATAVAEGGNITFTITRSGSGAPSTVYLSTAGVSASTADFAALDQFALNFASYETVKNITVRTYQDTTTEGTESFSLGLYKNVGDTSQTSAAPGYIKDQYLPTYGYTITSNAGSPATAVTEGGQVTFTITRSGSGTVSTVYVSTAEGSAGASDYVGLSQKAIAFAANEKIATVTIDLNQDWWLEAAEFFNLNLYKNQADAMYASSGSAFINDKPAAAFNYTITNNASTAAPVTEGTAVIFTITRSGTGAASSVFLSTSTGTAVGSDYQGLDKYELNFAAYESEKSVTVNTKTDQLIEGNEYFALNLYRNYSDSSYTSYSTATVKDPAVVATDYDYTVTSSASVSPATEGSAVTFTVTRSGSGTAATIYWDTENGTASGEAGDFQGANATALSFAAYETSKSITVNTYTDNLTEGVEYFWLNVFKTYADASNYNWASYGTALIEDRQAAADYDYTVTSNAGYDAPLSEGSAVTFTVTRNGSGSASSVFLSTYAGSADYGDYQALDRLTLNFAAFETSKTITVNTYTDSLQEGDEYFFLELFKTHADALVYDWASYGTAYLTDPAVTAAYDYTVTSSAGANPVTEGGMVTFTITRSGSGSASTIYWDTEAGTASPDTGDYEGTGTSTLSFAANETSKTITVNTYTDRLTEGVEYFWLNVFKTYADAVNYNWASYGTALIEDAPVTADYDYTVTSSAGADPVTEGGTVTFTIARSGSGTPSTVYWDTEDGTANGELGDFEGTGTSTLSFAANETSKTITVDTYTDTLAEGIEYFWLNVFKTYADATSYNWASYGTALIEDAPITADYDYTVTSSASADPVTEGGIVTFTIERSGSGSASTVYWDTEAGTASPDTGDYEGTDTSTLSFAANETSKTITVNTYTDRLTEGYEYFWLNVFKTYADAINYNWASYGTAFIQDPVAQIAVQSAVQSSSAGAIRATSASAQTATVASQSFHGHSLGGFNNDFAFAALKSDGSVVSWGYGPNGGDRSAVAGQLNGDIDVQRIYASNAAFAALRADGSVITWGSASTGGDSSPVATELNGTVDVTQIYSTETAFAAVRTDGSVTSWGEPAAGGDSSAVRTLLNGDTDVTRVYSTMSSFAALRADGSVVTWGHEMFGGNSTAVASQLNGGIDVTQIVATGSAFAAIRTDGSVVTWGNEGDGGNSAAVASTLNGEIDVVSVCATTSAFAALRADGSVITWGDVNNGGNSSAVATRINGLTDVTGLVSSYSAFAALRSDGSVVTWGSNDGGGNSTSVASSLSGGVAVTKIYANAAAFAALRADGSVVSWGYGAYGGDQSAVAAQLNGTVDVVSITPNDHAFAAIRADGSVVTWGSLLEGGDSTSVQAKLDGTVDVTQLAATSASFSALRSDGTVITWGNLDKGGDSTSVASQLTSVVGINEGALNIARVALNGTTANDTLASTAGNDAIDGKAGIDTAVYTARMAAYTVSPTVISGPDGSDTLTSVERLQFTDAFLAFDLDGNAGQTYRLYQAAFNRTPDLGGLGGWIAAMDSGTTLAQVATSFMGSAEFQALYGANPSNEQFVSLLYTNALHRTADAGGLAYWVNQLASGLQTRAQALVNLSESAENKASVLPAIAKGIVYANATQAAGPAKGQSFSGTSSADSLIGTVGNDTLTGGGGNDSLNGGGGLDTAIYSGTRASHTTTNASGNLTVSGGADGADTLDNVERLKFDNAILAFDTSGNAGQTYRLYQAAFNRTPDKDGLSGWVKGVDSGMTMLKVAAAFIESGEFKTLYGNSPTDTAFVNLLYTNALHRTADAGGLEYWVNQLSSHSQSREQALLGFSESAENQAALIGVIQNGIELAV